MRPEVPNASSSTRLRNAVPIPSPGRDHGDALQIEVAVRVVEAGQDGEGERLALGPNAEPVGRTGRSEHRAVLLRVRAADPALEARPALERHDRLDVVCSGGSQ